jgi:hypothetical protein
MRGLILGMVVVWRKIRLELLRLEGIEVRNQTRGNTGDYKQQLASYISPRLETDGFFTPLGSLSEVW